jgi:hypothetical protein
MASGEVLLLVQRELEAVGRFLNYLKKGTLPALEVIASGEQAATGNPT